MSKRFLSSPALGDPAILRRAACDAVLKLDPRKLAHNPVMFVTAVVAALVTVIWLRKQAEGVDVVLGLIDTHGRKETADLLEGLELLPRKRVPWQGRFIDEFDIDAALARKPALLVLDELAHTNAPDSRHPKRWQDLEELLDKGIDVWTALNVQHLESLADVVSRITGVQVRETVPDVIIQEAEEVVVVDITPEELIARLQAGKVYMPETAQRATQNFFTAGNLTALRELALRRTAERVDDQVVEYLRQKAIEGPWETSERLLVCIGGETDAEAIVRKASRMATGLNATWIAVHMEQQDEAQTAAPRVQAVTQALALAEKLGADTLRVASNDFVADILRLARRENVTQIVVGRSSAGPIARLLGRSLPDRLATLAGDIGVHIVPAVAVVDHARRWRRLFAGFADRRELAVDSLAALVNVAAAVGIAQAVSLWRALPNLSMVFLAAVLVCAAFRGTRSAIIAAVLSFLAYNFFFIEPIHTFTVAEPHELLALLVYLTVAVLTGSLAGRLHQQKIAAQNRTRATLALYEFSRKMVAAAGEEDVALISTTHTHRMLALNCCILLPRGTELEVIASWPPADISAPAEISAARWAFEHAEPAGCNTGTLPNVRLQFRPLISPRACVGVLGFEYPGDNVSLDPETESALSSIVEQTAIALDRAILVGEAMKSATLEQNEAVREALLASLSHDLRTPLTTITGAASTLRELGEAMDSKKRAELVSSIEQEASRLSRFVTNMLEMSRIDSGALKLRRDWVDVADVIRAAASRAERIFGRAPRLSLAQDLPYLRGDAHLLEQVVFNLLDNAYKYGGEQETPVIHARQEADEVVITVTDAGPGIKPENLERVFEKFFRAGRADARNPGTGLGLAICRGVIKAMGGSITAQSPAARKRGTRIVIRLPKSDPQETSI